MKVTKHECKINGVHVMEVTVRALTRTSSGGAPIMEATYATAERHEEGSITTVATHGRCTANPLDQNNPWRWSPETMKRLDELLTSMEQDLLPRHFKIPAGLEREDERTGPSTVEEADQI